MPTETDLVELLHAIGDRAPDADQTLDVLSPRLRTAAPPHPARRVLAIAAAVVTVAGVGIGSAVVLRGGGDTNTAAGYADAEPTTNHETYELPLDRYHASNTQLQTLQRAQDVLETRCAQARGVSPVRWQGIPHGDEARAFLADVADDVRPLTLRQARAFGYDRYPGGLGPQDGIRTGPLTKAQMRVWEPCAREATRTLLRGAGPAAPGRLRGDGQPELVEDDVYVRDVFVSEARANSVTPPVERAQRRWSACMEDHGFAGLASTVTAIAKQRAPHSAAAKRQAVQDVECKEATGFMTVWVDALREAQRVVIAEHRDELRGFERRLKIRLANAARVLAQR